MADQGEIICLDDSESDEPQHRDMGVGTTDNQEDVKIVESKDGVLSKLENIAETSTKRKDVGPSDRAFWGKGGDDSDEIEIVDTKEVKQTILEVRNAVVGEATSSKRAVKDVVKEKKVGVSSNEEESDDSEHRAEAKLLGLHRNPSGQATLNFGNKIRRNKGRQNSVERREGRAESITELKMESIKTLLARAKPKKKNDNINISISKSAMKLSKNMNISISMVAGEKKERRSTSSLGNQSSSVICIDSSESDSEQRRDSSTRESVGREKVESVFGRDKERDKVDTDSERGRDNEEIARKRLYATTIKERFKEKIRKETGNIRERRRLSGGKPRGHQEENSESDGDSDSVAVQRRESNRFEWDRGRRLHSGMKGGNVHGVKDYVRPDWLQVKGKDKKRPEDIQLRKRSSERDRPLSPIKTHKILEKYSPPKPEKFRRRRSNSQESSSSQHASHSRSSTIKKKRKLHRGYKSTSSSSSSSSTSSSSSSSSSISDSDDNSSVLVSKKRKKVYSSRDSRNQESTSEMAVKRLKKCSDQATETTSEKYIKQLKSSSLLTLTSKSSKSLTKPEDYATKSTSELFLENLEKDASSRSPSPPPVQSSSDSESEHSDSRSKTSDQLFDRLLQETSRTKSYFSPIKMTDTDSPGASSDERLGASSIFKPVMVKDGVDAFLRSCQRILPSDEFNPVFKKVSKYMSNLSPMYLNSSSLKTFLDYKWALLDKDIKNVYIHVKDVLDELKKYKNEGSGAAGANSEVSDHPSSNPNKRTATGIKKYESPPSSVGSPEGLSSGKELETVEKIINKSPVHLWSALDHRDSIDIDTETDHKCSGERKAGNDDLNYKQGDSSTDENLTQFEENLTQLKSEESEIDHETNVDMDGDSSQSKGKDVCGQALFAFLDLQPKATTSLPVESPSQSIVEPPMADQVPKHNLVKKRVMLSTISKTVAKVRDLSPVQGLKSSAEKQCFNINLLTKDSPHVSDNDEFSDKEDELLNAQDMVGDNVAEKEGKKGASGKHIKKLEKALRMCSKQIKKHEEADIDWEKDDDSNFIMAAKLKKRYMAIYNKIAEYKGLSKSLDRRSDKKFSFTESKYPAINQKIEKFVNRTKTFPDFVDIRKAVEEVNVKRQLLLTEMQVHTEAERIFVIIGKKLKRRRNDDEGLVMYSYLKPDDQGDPAVKDRELERKLDELGKIAKEKIEKVFEDYVEKQVSKGKSGEDEGDEINDDDEISDDDEEYEDDEGDIEEPSSQLSVQSEEQNPVIKSEKFKTNTKDSYVKKVKPFKLKIDPRPSTSLNDSEPGESEPSDAVSLGDEDSDSDEHAEHEREMVDILNYDPDKRIEVSPVGRTSDSRKDSIDRSRPGSAGSRRSVGSVEDLLDDSDGEG